ncbi:MAG: hypothetical protein ACE5LA_04455 [Dehalococcoidales bacterium]
MDLGEVGRNLVIVLVIAFFLVLNVVIRARRGRGTPLGMVVTLLSEINQNQRLIETFDFHWRTKKFKTGCWKRNKRKLDFLPQELLTCLSDTFGIAEDFNQKMDAARKYKSDSYLASISVDKLKLPLHRSKQQLEEWLQANMQNPDYFPRRRSLFG